MLLKNALAYLIARGLPGLINFAALATYSRLLSPEDYGRYALVVAGVGLAQVIGFQWLQLVLSRFLPSQAGNSKAFLGKLAFVFGAIGLVLGITGFLLALLLPDPVWQKLLVSAVLLTVTSAWMELDLTFASTRFNPGDYGRLIGTKALLALGLGAGLTCIGLGVYGPLLGLVAGNCISTWFFGRPAWRDIRLQKPELDSLKAQLHYGLPLTFTFALGWFISCSDRFLIGMLLDASATGLYSVGYDLSQNSVGMLLSIVQVAAYPLAVSALENGGAEAAREQIRQNGELIIGIALAASVGLAVLAREIASTVVGMEYRDAVASLIPWVAMAAALAGIKAFYFDIAFHLGGRTRGLMLISLVTALANVLLNLALIPGYGLQGAAWAAVLAFALGTGISWGAGRRAFPMPAFFASAGRASVVGLATAAGAWLSRGVGPDTGLWLGLGMGTASAIVAAYVVNLAGLRQAMLMLTKDLSK